MARAWRKQEHDQRGVEIQESFSQSGGAAVPVRVEGREKERNFGVNPRLYPTGAERDSKERREMCHDEENGPKKMAADSIPTLSGRGENGCGRRLWGP